MSIYSLLVEKDWAAGKRESSREALEEIPGKTMEKGWEGDGKDQREFLHISRGIWGKNSRLGGREVLARDNLG